MTTLKTFRWFLSQFLSVNVHQHSLKCEDTQWNDSIFKNIIAQQLVIHLYHFPDKVAEVFATVNSQRYDSLREQ